MWGGNPLSYVDKLGLDYECTYSQASGWITCLGRGNDEGKSIAEKCYAGKGDDKNNPASNDKVAKGPITRGDWYIGNSDSSKGPVTIDLHPSGDNSVHNTNRDGTTFRMHGDSADNPGSASEGCIICSRPTRDKLDESKGVIHVTPFQ